MRVSPACVAFAVIVLASACLHAASPGDFALRVVIDERTDAGPVAGGSAVDFKARVLLTSRVAAVQGWTFGLILQSDPGLSARIVSAETSRGVTTIAHGAPPAVDRLDFFTAEDPATPACSWTPPEGWWKCTDGSPAFVGVMQTVRISAGDLVTLNATEDLAVLELTIRVVTPVVPPPEEPAPLTVTVAFTDAFGNPPTPTAVLHGGLAIAPAAQEGALLDGFPLRCHVPRQLTIACEDGSTYVSGKVTSLVTLNFDSDPETPHDKDVEIQGWSYGLCVDPARIQVLETTLEDTDTETCACGYAPDYEAVDIFPEGVTHSVVVSLKGGRKDCRGVGPRNGWRDLHVTYAVRDGAEGEVSHVTPCSGVLHKPEWDGVTNGMYVVGEMRYASSAPGIDPARECCVPAVCNRAARITVAASPPILGGNANSDARLDIGDAIYLLQYLFADGRAPRCMAAADFNADEKVDIGDPIAIVMYLLPDPGRPPQPAWHIGCYPFDPRASALDCVMPSLGACGGQGR